MPPAKMIAAVYRGVDDVRVEQVPVPTIGPGEVLVRVRSCGICGTDLKKIRYGLASPPRIFGHEMAGTIERVGTDVTGWTAGDRVAVMHHVPCMSCHYCSHQAYAQCPKYKETGTTAGFEPAGGGFAEYLRVMDWVVARGLARLPDHLSYDEASFVEPLNTCLKAVLRTHVRAGDSAVVIGQGQIGLLFTQLLAWKTADVVAIDPIPHRRAMASHMGAAAALDPGASDVPAEVRKLTCGRGADAAIVAVASAEAVATALDCVRPAGRVLLFGHTRLGDPVHLDTGSICMLEKDLIGSYSSDITLQDQVCDLIGSGAINVRDLVTHSYRLAEIGSAIELALAPRDNSLKVMVNP